MSGTLTAHFEKRFPRGAVIQGRLELPVEGFHVTVLFGPSGCGKTTMLRCLAGLEWPDAGTISFNGNVWFDAATRRCLPPQDRDVGFVFQEYALFPHLTVARNVGYGLRRLGRQQRQARIAEMIGRFQLQGLEHRLPRQISGGQQQRVALARALARRPKLLLLDEPLSALDAALRDELRLALRDRLAEFGIPAVLVTHDRVEAISLADQLVVMHNGAVLQHGSVHEVFNRPANIDVARIVGVETVIPAEVLAVDEGLATVEASGVRLTAVAPAGIGRQVYVCIKGEEVLLLKQPHHDMSVRNQFPVRVRWLAPEGALVRVGLDAGFELTALVTRPACEELALQPGLCLTAAVKAPSIHLIERGAARSGS